MNYLTISNPNIYEETCKRSKFISYSFQVDSEDEVKSILKNIKSEHHSAKHHVYAYILENNSIEKYSDDGEPCGTAGLPILNAIKSKNLTNTLIIIVRYFGGILLGTTLLRNMYKKGATEVLKKSEFLEVIPYKNIDIKSSYKKSNKILYIIKQHGGNILESKFDSEVCIKANIPKEKFEDVKLAVNLILENDNQ